MISKVFVRLFSICHSGLLSRRSEPFSASRIWDRPRDKSRHGGIVSLPISVPQTHVAAFVLRPPAHTQPHRLAIPSKTQPTLSLERGPAAEPSRRYRKRDWGTHPRRVSAPSTR